MNFRRVLTSSILFNSVIKLQARSFAREPFPNKVTHYLHRARLIDSVRLTLRSPHKPDSLASLFNHRLLDPFVVTHALRAAPSADAAWAIINVLKSNTRFSHNQATVHTLCTVLAKFRRVSELRSLINKVKDGNFGNVSMSFMNLLSWYDKAGDFDSVINTWEEYRLSEEKGVCAESYNIVMNVYAKTGRDSEAVEVFRQMINEGAIPNSRTYTVMIEHLVSSGSLDAALEVFSALPSMRIKRTLKHYLALIQGLVRRRRFDEVKGLLGEMRRDGKFPSRDMIEPLQRMREAGFVGETEEILSVVSPNERIKSVKKYYMDSSEDEEDENGDDADADTADVDVRGVSLKPWLDPRALASALKQWSPEAVTELENANIVWTNRLVCKVLRNFKSPQTAWSFFCWVAYQPGFTHDAYTVERMMAILARHGHVELVDKLIAKVRIEGIRLPFSTIRLIIEFYGISKKADAALKVFRYDRTLCGSISKFNLMILYSSLLRTLTKCRRDTDTLDTLDEMILNGICPDLQTFSGLIYHFALQGDIKSVQKLFTMVRQMGLEPDAYMLKIVIQAYCRSERAILAWRVFEDMRGSNLVPDVATKELLVKSLWKEGKRKEAASVEETCEDVKSLLPRALCGHAWTVTYADLSKVSNIYASSFNSR